MVWWTRTIDLTFALILSAGIFCPFHGGEGTRGAVLATQQPSCQFLSPCCFTAHLTFRQEAPQDPVHLPLPHMRPRQSRGVGAVRRNFASAFARVSRPWAQAGWRPFGGCVVLLKSADRCVPSLIVFDISGRDLTPINSTDDCCGIWRVAHFEKSRHLS